MLKALTVIGRVVLLVLALLVTTAWLTLRLICRSRLVAPGAGVLAELLVPLTPLPLRPPSSRDAAVRALHIARQHRLLRQRVAFAQRSGSYLGDVPALLPRLEAQGRRLRAAVGQLDDSSAAGHELLVQADRHLATLADLAEAVDGATAVPVADGSLAREAADAASALRVHSAAYTELMGTDLLGSAQPPLVDAP